MRRAHVLSLVTITVLGCGGGGGGTPEIDAGPADSSIDGPVLPVFRNPVNLPDDQLAMQALKLLGADVPGTNTASCNGCHGMTKQSLRYWRALSDTSMTECLTDLQVTSQASAMKMIDCMRAMPTLPTSDFDTKKLGIWSTASKLPWFQYTFWMAYGSEGDAKLAQFQAEAGMPKEGISPLTQSEFDIVAEWFVRGLPGLDATLVTDPPPSSCQPGISSDVAAHVASQATQSWRSVNRMNQMAMHGCGAATDPKLCLQDVPLASTMPYGAGWDLPGRGRARILKDVDYVTSFWTRSSPDGRFVGHGVANVTGSYIVDLQRDVLVNINSSYDPAFFPDNSGFVFQGGPRNTCGISVLTSNPASITMSETACRRISAIGLYQHVGQQLGAGGDYFALDNQFVSDDGGKNPTRRDPDANFGSNAYSSFTPLIWNGTTYQQRLTVNIDTPFEGDTVLSHSAKLTIARVAGPNDDQIGYVLRKINATFNAATQMYDISAPEIARYCFSGGKPAFSYDERFIAYHHYVTAADAVELGFTGPSDPGFAPYMSQGAANIYLMDLRTGVRQRLTHMQPGQYALFPHFRSDGWLYLQVRDAVNNREYITAHDGALILE